MNYCSNCGAKLEAGQEFCPKCGAKVEAKNADNTNDESYEAYKNRLENPALSKKERAKIGSSTIKIGWLILGALIPLVGFILAPLWWHKNYPRAVSLLSGACAGFVIGLLTYFHAL